LRYPSVEICHGADESVYLIGVLPRKLCLPLVVGPILLVCVILLGRPVRMPVPILVLVLLLGGVLGGAFGWYKSKPKTKL
jgi:hypothetical protein